MTPLEVFSMTGSNTEILKKRKQMRVMLAGCLAAGMLAGFSLTGQNVFAAVTEIDAGTGQVIGGENEPQPLSQGTESVPEVGGQSDTTTSTQTTGASTEDVLQQVFSGNTQDSSSSQGRSDNSMSTASGIAADNAVAGFGSASQQVQEDSSQSDESSEDDSMPEWTDKLVTGRGESADGFSGSSSAGNSGYSSAVMEYEGELDLVSGQPLGKNGESISEDARIDLSQKMLYDRGMNCFVFLSSRFNCEVMSSVADGMITQDSVGIRVPEGVQVSLYRDGELLENQDLEMISQEGAYAVRLGSGVDVEDLFSFTIIGTTTGAVNYYDMPDGFQVDSVYIDGVQINNNRTRIEMITEGEMKAEYSCPKADLHYTLRVIIDHTPPQLTFIGVDEQYRARGPVTWEGLEKGESMTFLKDGAEYKVKGNTLKSSGQYQITAVDQAGNESEYVVTILLYLNAQSVVFFALFLAIIAAVIIYLHVERARMRVR